MGAGKEFFVLYFLLTSFVHLSSPSTTTSHRATTEICVDKIADCDHYAESNYCSGIYEPWAKLNCEASCGFCVTAATVPPPCVDNLDNCNTYGTEVCTAYASWSRSNCRLHCRYCSAEQLAEIDSTTVATIPPALCVDKVECKYYQEPICTDPLYKPWADANCPLFCGVCVGLATPPKPCVDLQPDCPNYGTDICYNDLYRFWVEDHCPKFCGFCGSNTRPATPIPVTTPSSGTTAPSGSTVTTHSTNTIRTPEPVTGFKTPPPVLTPRPPSPPPLRTHPTLPPKP